MKLKIVTGFRKDQQHTIDESEAHKAYFLFMNPEKRAIFKDGLALRGNDIQQILPDYNATMGWNPTYQIGDYDWEDIQKKGIDDKLRDIMYEAKQIALAGNENLLKLPLGEAKQLLLKA